MVRWWAIPGSSTRIRRNLPKPNVVMPGSAKAPRTERRRVSRWRASMPASLIAAVTRLHKLSTRLIRENQVVCVESLAVKNMVKHPTLSKAISDVGWSAFVSQLDYKATWYGGNPGQDGQVVPIQ